MIRIAIVEDEAEYTHQLEEYLHTFEKQTERSFEIKKFSDGDAFVSSFKSQFDIILMDVEMPLLDGMSAAEEVRRTDSEVIIIFITNMAQYAIKGYAVDALDYVLKPVSYFAFSQRLERALGKIKTPSKKYIAISIKNGGSQKLDISDITYVESQGHDLTFHIKSSEQTYITIGTMKDIEQKLDGNGFFRSNKGYLVNFDHVDGIKDNCAVVNGTELLISRTRRNEFLQALTRHIVV